jgi:hypothetical protein
MKKLIIAISAILYLGTSTGATLHLHYCMGELVDWSAWAASKGKCGKCGMIKKTTKAKDCCKDEQKQVKLHSDQKRAELAIVLMHLSISAQPVSIIEIYSPKLSSISEKNPTSNAPPGDNAVPVYIRNRVFRI